MKFIKKIWKQWLKIGRIIGNFQAQVIFTLFYFILFWMVGLISRLSSDPLRLKKPNHRSNYSPWEYKTETLEQARKQY